MGCCHSDENMDVDLKKIVKQPLFFMSNLSSEKTKIYFGKKIVWKLYEGEDLVQIKENILRIKRLANSPHLLIPFRIIQLTQHKLAISMHRATMDLHTYMSTPFEWSVVSSGLTDISNAIAYLHSIGLAHKDIKPENIVLDDKTFKLIDFDFSLELDDFKYCGTVNFLPLPTSIQNWECKNKQLDMYAFGKTVLCVLWTFSCFRKMSVAKYVQKLYMSEFCPPATPFIFSGSRQYWFNIAVQCCQRNPLLTILATEADTGAAKDVIATVTPLEVGFADESFAHATPCSL